MKVGTDAVLLGSWVNCTNAKNILDVGCGTGVISLMLAQRNLNANIIGIDIDALASLEAQLNINQSDWSQRISIIKTSFQDFNVDIRFDLISTPFNPVISIFAGKDLTPSIVINDELGLG